MEGFQKFVRSITKDSKSDFSFPEIPFSFTGKGGGAGGGGGVTAVSDQSNILVTRSPRQMVSLGTCSKLCTVFFVAGVVVGYTLKRRVRMWASRLLKRLRDD